MRITYATEPLPESFSSAIFLAGPTPRDGSATSWRPAAIAELAAAGYSGDVFTPEPRGSWAQDYDDQIDWESEALALADVILFWVPRRLPSMPAFTTNVEFGAWLRSGKAVVGSPRDAEKIRYLQASARRAGLDWFEDLTAIAGEAVRRCGTGAQRQGGERGVPLEVWRQPGFQAWLAGQRAAGHDLVQFDLLWGNSMGGDHWGWVAWPQVRVAGEDRVKSNEVMFARPDIDVICAHGPLRGLDTEVVLVNEYRVPVRNASGFVCELPGGSASEAPGRAVAAAELAEETGLAINAERFELLGTRQVMATLVISCASLWTVELTAEELHQVRATPGPVGVDDGERCYPRVATVREIRSERLVDWAAFGMVAEAILA